MLSESDRATAYEPPAGVRCSHCRRPHTIDDPVWQQVKRILTHPRDVAPDGELAQYEYQPEYTVSVYVRSKLCRILRHRMSHSRALSIGRVLAESDTAIECVVHDGEGRTVRRIRASVAPVAALGGIEVVQ